MSITLSASAISVKSVGGVSKETNNTDAMTTIQIDFQQNTVVFNVLGGALAGQVFTPGTIGDAIQVSIDLTTGKWNASNNLTGTLSAPALANLLTTLKGLRNTGETFCTGNAIVAGSQVAWT
jgi:hypothetical protein